MIKFSQPVQMQQSWLLREVREEILESLAKIFYCSINIGIVPEDWRNDNITFLFFCNMGNEISYNDGLENAASVWGNF